VFTGCDGSLYEKGFRRSDEKGVARMAVWCFRMRNEFASEDAAKGGGFFRRLQGKCKGETEA